MVGKFVEFFGDGAATPARARARHALQHGARVRRHHRLLPAGRAVAPVPRADRAAAGAWWTLFRAYYAAQGMLRIPRPGEVDYSEVIELDLAAVRPAVAGPKRPQDRIELPALGTHLPRALLAQGRDRLRQGRRRARPPLPLDAGAEREAAAPGGGLQDPESAPGRGGARTRARSPRPR